MGGLRRYGIPVLIMAIMTMVLGTVAIGVLYDTAFEVERRRLLETAHNQARIMEAVARFDQAYSGNYPDGETAATISQITEAYQKSRITSKTGEFVLARRQGDQMIFVLRQHQDNLETPRPIAFNSPLEEPMRRALSGLSGVMVGRDYRGVTVLAAYEPVAILKLGLVAKIDLAEIRAPFIRAPFIRAALIVAGLGGIILAVGVALFIGADNAVSRRIQDSEARYRALSGLASEGVVIHENGVIVESNQAFADMYGYTELELVGKQILDLNAPETQHEVAGRLARNANGNYEGVGLHKNGSRIPVEIKSMPVVYRNHLMRVSRISDLTERHRAAAAIRDSEERYKNITDNLPVLIAYIDRDLRYRAVNRMYETWYQKPVSEIIGRHMSEIMLPETYAQLEEPIQRALAGEVAMHEGESQTPDGIHRYHRVHYLPHRAEDGEVLGFYALVEDITDIRRATLALERQGDSLATAQRIGNMGNWERDFKTGELRWSDQAYRIFGLSREPSKSLTREDFLDTLHVDDRPFVVAALTAAAENDAPYSLDHRIVRPDGEVRVVHEEAEVIRDAAGQPLVMAGTVQDITERKEIEQALRDSEQQLRLVTDSLPVMINYVDAGERYRFVNKAAEQAFGHPRSRIIGATTAEILGRVTYAQVRVFMAEALSGTPQRYDSTFTYPDGVTRDMEVTYVPHMGPHGDVLGFFSLAVDVTERHALEDRLRQSQKMEAMGQLTGGVAHEFNNLLQVVIGNLELLVAGAPADSVAEQRANAIRRNVARGADLTNQLLSFSRQAPLAPKAVEIGATLVRPHAVWKRTLGEMIDVRMEIPDDTWMIKVDSGQLESALLNLALNARDAMPGGGTITITARNTQIDGVAADRQDVAPGDYVLLCVADTGDGMTEDALSRAFEPFFTTKDIGKGTGLGLSMVHGFAHQSGGYAEIDTELGQGTTIGLYLPRWEAAAAEAPSAAADAMRSAAASKGHVILLVEDDADVRQALAQQLASLECRIIEAQDGLEALAIVESGQKIDLLFTDVVMPGGMNGMDLARFLRNTQPGLKVIYTTGYADDIVAKLGRLEDNAILLRKPYDRNKLIRTVALALPR